MLQQNKWRFWTLGLQVEPQSGWAKDAGKALHPDLFILLRSRKKSSVIKEKQIWSDMTEKKTIL